MNVTNNQAFTGGGKGNGVATVVLTNGGQLQAQGADGTWVDVPDGSGTVFSFYIEPGISYRLTGITGSEKVTW